jgi:hypothetical protein
VNPKRVARVGGFNGRSHSYADRIATYQASARLIGGVIVHPFAPNVVRKTVVANCPGAYALGSLICGVFSRGYVGRSDHCVRERLATHELLGQFEVFEVQYARDAMSAFLLECAYWHEARDSGRLLANKSHPAAPRKTKLRCAYCEFAEGAYQYSRPKRARTKKRPNGSVFGSNV